MTIAVPQQPATSATFVDLGDAEQSDLPRKGGLLFFVASLTSQVVALLRYVVLARLLGPEQLGLAAALTITASLFDMISDTGSDRFLIQDRHGDTIAVQNLVQLFDVGRGVLVAAGLIVSAVPIAYLYNNLSLATGFMFIAVAPFVLGFAHLDNRRMQRRHDFRSEAICIISSEFVGLVTAIIAAGITRDFKSVAYALIARAITRVIASHLLAERRFRLGWKYEHASRLGHFAAPLMLNGLLLFIFSQGDRVIVGSHLGISSLGYYSTIILMVYYPSSTLASYVHTIYVPVIAAGRDSRSEQGRASDRLGDQCLMLALLMAVGFAIVAPPMTPILFGSRFAQPALLVGLVGCLQAARFFLTWPTTIALALGRSSNVLMSNITQLLIFPGAMIGLQAVGGLSGIVIGFIGAEFIAIALALALLNRTMGQAMYRGFWRLGALTATTFVISGWNLALQAFSGLAITCMLGASIALVVWLYPRQSAVAREALAATHRAIRGLKR